MLYQDDRDFEGFKARIIHKVMTPNGSRENREAEYAQSATSPGFQYPGTAIGGSRRRVQQYSDSYMSIIADLEQKQLLNDDTSSIIKQLILDENVDIQRVLNSYNTRIITDKELSFKLTRLAQQLGTYLERPQSPLPKRKQELINYVNSLARYHFRDPDDV